MIFRFFKSTIELIQIFLVFANLTYLDTRFIFRKLFICKIFIHNVFDYHIISFKVESYDSAAPEDDEESPLVASTCVRDLIKLAGVTLGKR